MFIFSLMQSFGTKFGCTSPSRNWFVHAISTTLPEVLEVFGQSDQFTPKCPHIGDGTIVDTEELTNRTSFAGWCLC